jgi:hypothetical protein
MNAVEQAVETSKELAARQADNLESVATELFCSPEILRQVLHRESVGLMCFSTANLTQV